MSDKRILGGTMTTTRKPRVILVGTAIQEVKALGLHADNCDVITLPVSNKITCAVLARKPSVVVLPECLDQESGYLVAAKLRAAKPRLKVVLIAATRTPEAERFAKFVGVTFVAHTDGASKLVEAITCPEVARGRDCV